LQCEHLLAAAFSISVTITWWRSALHGTKLACLHHISDCRAGPSFISAITAGSDARKVVLAAAVIAIVKFVNNPLLQRATHIRTQHIVTNDTIGEGDSKDLFANISDEELQKYLEEHGGNPNAVTN